MRIYSFDEDFRRVTFFAKNIGILGIDLVKIDLEDDNNFDENDPDTIIDVRILDWCKKF